MQTNAAIGAEWNISLEVQVRLGAFGNLATTLLIEAHPKRMPHPASTTLERPQLLDTLGATTTSPWTRRPPRHRTRSGLTDNATAYFRTNAESPSHLPGGYRRAATTLVRDVGRRIQTGAGRGVPMSEYGRHQHVGP